MIEGGLCTRGHLLTPDVVTYVYGYVRCKKCAVIIARECTQRKRARTGWRPKRRLPTVERFWKFVNPEPNTGCWLWSAHLDDSGYGVFSVGRDWHNQKASRTFRAHRVSYEINVGPIPDGLQLDHICRVRSCVNPAHLRPVTAQQNTQYARPYISAAHRNRKKTHCPKGHPYNAENTAICRDGARRCRACRRVANGDERVPSTCSNLFASRHAANLHEEQPTCRFLFGAEFSDLSGGEKFTP